MAYTGRLKKFAPLLLKLYKSNKRNKRTLLTRALKKQQFLNVICEICKNVLSGNVPLSASQRRRLCKNKCLLRKLAEKKIGAKKKKRLVMQNGGFLGALLTPIVSILGGLLGGLSS